MKRIFKLNRTDVFPVENEKWALAEMDTAKADKLVALYTLSLLFDIRDVYEMTLCRLRISRHKL